MDFLAKGVSYFVRGGLVMYPLLLCSILVVVIAVERYLFYKKADSGKEFTDQFCDYIEHNDWTNAKKLADATPGEIAKLATVVMAHHGNFERLESFVSARAERALDKFEDNLAYLNVLISLSPVLGLLGTVTGMISSFNALDVRVENPMAVTAGIAEALITTVFGLCIAIVGICVHAYFTKRLKGITLCLEEMSNTLLEAIAKDLDKKQGV
jgi:biopolymer transport protein ExbB